MPHAAEASANNAMPVRKTLRRPKRSPAARPTRMRAPRKSPEDATTDCTSITPALKLDSRAGNATLTTVLSMKAMLVPRMAAARIHGPDCGRQGELAGAERMAASSQGGVISGKDAIGAEEVSGKVRRCMFAVGCL